MRETVKINRRQSPVILRKFHENSRRLRQLTVIKKTQKFSKIRKIDKKLLKSSKNCYTGNIFKAAEKRAEKGFDRACERGFSVFAAVGRSSGVRRRFRPYRSVCGSGLIALSLWRYVCGFACCCSSTLMGLCVVMIFAPVRDLDRSLSLLRRHAYGFECFCVFMFAFYRSLCFCAVEVDRCCGFMFLLLSFSAARGFRFFELLKRSTAFLRR